jgi:trimethylamine:corrinoid methyltransferase-like protein
MAERALICETVVLAGADILGGVGQLECATVFSPVQAALDNELGGMMRKFTRLPDVDDEVFDWPEISMMRGGGHFLDSPHTLKYCRDQYHPRVFLRENRDDYERSGRRTVLDQTRMQCLDYIRRPPPEGLPSPDVVKEMRHLTAAADRDILGAAAASTGARAEI